MTEIIKQIVEIYGLVGIVLLYLLKKDYDSQNVLKRLTEAFIEKVEDLKVTMSSIRKLAERFNKITEEQEARLKELERENRDMREEIRKLKERKVI